MVAGKRREIGKNGGKKNIACQQEASHLIAYLIKQHDDDVTIEYLSKVINVGRLVDEGNRSLLHIAASMGRNPLVSWLVQQGACMEKGDYESGWTGIHRAAFYGHLHTVHLLLQLGCSREKKDKEGLTFSQLLSFDAPSWATLYHPGLIEAYTWGSNNNHHLGHSQTRNSPEQLDLLRKKNYSIKMISMSTYHSILLTQCGRVLTCGHGLGGRLGHGSEEAVLTPKLIKTLKNLTWVSASLNSSFFLNTEGQVYCCGTNTHQQLCQQSSHLLTPKLLTSNSLRGMKVVKVISRRHHTVLLTSAGQVFTHGLNAGQIGHNALETVVTQPRLVTSLIFKDTSVCLVASSDACVLVLTGKRDVSLLHKHTCSKIVPRQLGVREVCVSGGSLDRGVTDVTSFPVLAVFIHSTGNVSIWREEEGVLRGVVWSPHRPISVTSCCLSKQRLLFTSSDGQAFFATVPKSTSSPVSIASSSSSKITVRKESCSTQSRSLQRLLEQRPVVRLWWEGVAAVHRAVAVCMDDKAVNFAVLQTNDRANLISVPMADDSRYYEDMRGLMNSALDLYADVELKYGARTQAAHKWVLSNSSPYFLRLFNHHHHHHHPHHHPHNHHDDDHHDNHNPHHDDGTKASFNNGDAPFNNGDSSLNNGNSSLKNGDTNSNGSGRRCGDGDGVSGDGDGGGLKSVQIDLYGCDEDVFSEVIEFIYTGDCEILRSGGYDFGVNNGGKRNGGGGKGGGGHGRKRGECGGGEVDGGCMEVSDLKLLAKKYEITQLINRLQCVSGVRDARMKEGDMKDQTPHFDEQTRSIHTDISIVTEEGMVVDTHTCILAARSLYMRTLLSWSLEQSESRRISMKVRESVLQVVLYYLYEDCLPPGGQKLDLLVECLSVADQLLLPRLNSLLQVNIANFVHLKSAADLFSLSLMCNATQLTTTCLQFIHLNLPALLEIDCLQDLNEHEFQVLSNYYKHQINNIHLRKMPQYSEIPPSTHSTSHPSTHNDDGDDGNDDGDGDDGDDDNDEVSDDDNITASLNDDSLISLEPDNQKDNDDDDGGNGDDGGDDGDYDEVDSNDGERKAISSVVIRNSNDKDDNVDKEGGDINSICKHEEKENDAKEATHHNIQCTKASRNRYKKLSQRQRRQKSQCDVTDEADDIPMEAGDASEVVNPWKSRDECIQNHSPMIHSTNSNISTPFSPTPLLPKTHLPTPLSPTPHPTTPLSPTPHPTTPLSPTPTSPQSTPYIPSLRDIMTAEAANSTCSIKTKKLTKIVSTTINPLTTKFSTITPWSTPQTITQTTIRTPTNATTPTTAEKSPIPLCNKRSQQQRKQIHFMKQLHNDEHEEQQQHQHQQQNNAWRATTPTTPSDDLKGIMRTEEDMRQYSHELNNKSLYLVQLEERAIEELMKMYEGVNEVVSVCRLHLPTCMPLWKT